MLTPVGRTIGRYRIEERLGSDSVSEVFRAVHIDRNRPVAIKVLHPSLAADPSMSTRFLQEVQAAAMLRHPNIIEIYEFGEQDGQFYLAMELATAGSLRTLLQYRAAGQPLPLPLSLDLVRQAAEGLAYAHAQGMIHRNIKPDNLLLVPSTEPGPVSDRYIVKICGFGLSGLTRGSELIVAGDDDEGADIVGDRVGTPAYISPEQCQGIALDGRSDLYSLGVVLYEVTTGYIPFQAQTMSEAAYKHMHAPPPPPCQVRPELPEALEAIILCCLAKRPEERYASGTELAQALQGVIHALELAPDVSTLSTGRLTVPSSLPPSVPPAAIELPLPLTPAEPSGLAAAQSAESVELSTAASAVAARLAITLEQEALTITPGEPAALQMTLANIGQTVDHLKVVVEGVSPEWVQAPSDYLQLHPGTQLPATLTIVVPKVATSHAGEYVVTVRAISRKNPAESAHTQGRWNVLPFMTDSLSLRPERASGRGQAIYDLTLRNDGNAPGDYPLSGEDAEQKLTYGLPQKAISLAPGASSLVRITVHERRRWIGRPEPPYPFIIRSNSSGRTPLATAGQFINLPLLSFWALAGITLLVVVGLVAGYLLGLRPLLPPPWGTAAPRQVDIFVYAETLKISAGTGWTSVPVSCQTGEIMLGGGYSALLAGGGGQRVAESYPSRPNTWVATIDYPRMTSETTLTVYVVCGRANFPIAPSKISSGQVVDVPPGSQRTVVASCRAGATLTGGGYSVRSLEGTELSTIASSRPSSSTDWQVKAFNPSEGRLFSVQVFAVCANRSLSTTSNSSSSQRIAYDGKSIDSKASCASGSLAGGGYSSDGGFAFTSRPTSDAKRWQIQFTSTAPPADAPLSNTVTAYAVCVQPATR